MILACYRSHWSTKVENWSRATIVATIVIMTTDCISLTHGATTINDISSETLLNVLALQQNSFFGNITLAEHNVKIDENP